MAPFILPCLGILNKQGTNIKSFKNYITGAEEGLGSVLSNKELPRIKACTEIMKKSEASPGLVNLHEEKEKSETLAALFRMFQVSLPLFSDAILYVHPYYNKKRLGNRPVKTYLWRANIATGKPTLRFRLHNKGSHYQFTLSVSVNGKPVANPHIVASFFVSPGRGTSLYRFASLRDAGIAFWMEQNKGLITVFSNHTSLLSIATYWNH